MTSETTTKLICAECRHENEAERIYCHNCGGRLDRSAVVAKKKVDEAAEARRHLQQMLQGPSRTRHNFVLGCKLLLAAAGTAGLLQMFLPPEFPAPVKTTAPVQLDLELESASYKPVVLTFSQQDVNAYLTSRLSTKKKALNKPLLNFERAAIVFKEGHCIFGWERSVFGYPVYALSSYHVDLNKGKITAVNDAGWIGRLPIHPALMKYADVIFADLWKALDRERRLVSKMSSVVVHDGSATISSAGH